MVLSLVLAACTQNVDVTDPERAPTAVVLAPTSGSELPSGPTTFLGQVDDRETPLPQLFATWSLGPADGSLRDVCRGFADAQGLVQCTTELLPTDARLRLEVVDRAGYRDAELVQLDVRTVAPPVVRIVEPSTLRREWTNLPVRVRVEVADADHAPEELEVLWQSDRTGPVEGPSEVDADGVVTGALALSAGEHRLTVTVVDPDQERGRDTVRVWVDEANQPPTLRVDAPVADAVGATGEGLPFRAWVGDVEAPDDAVQVTVTSDGPDGLVLDQERVGHGFVEGTLALSKGSHRLTVDAVDVHGLHSATEVAVEVGDRPTLVVICPVEGTTDAVGEPIDVVVELADDGPVGDGLALTVASDRSGVVGTYAARSDGVALTRLSLAPGAHALTLTAVGADGLTRSSTVNVTVGGPAAQSCPAMDALLASAGGTP